MPGPITIYSTAKALQAMWRDSKKAREWLWGKVPIVKDIKKRELIEGHIARLLDDTSKLAQALPSNVLDDKIAERVTLFRQDLAKEGVVGEQAEALVERANLLVRLYVTGPLGDLLDLRFRLDEDEEALRVAELSIDSLKERVTALETRSRDLEGHARRLHMMVAVSATAAVFGLLVALVALAAHR